MRHYLSVGMLGLIALIAGAPPTYAESCSGRLHVCHAYCEKTYNNAPRCLGTCQGLFEGCKSTGCWESRITAKRCGFSRQ